MGAPEIAKELKQQVVETEHLFKALLEQPNGMARRIISKAGGDPSRLLDKTDAYIRRQPRVTGDAAQVRCCCMPGQRRGGGNHGSSSLSKLILNPHRLAGTVCLASERHRGSSALLLFLTHFIFWLLGRVKPWL